MMDSLQVQWDPSGFLGVANVSRIRVQDGIDGCRGVVVVARDRQPHTLERVKIIFFWSFCN